MPISEKKFLSFFGWDDFFESQVLDSASKGLFPARVICEERNLYRVQAGFDDIFWATVRGKLQYNASERGDFPAVGDWVFVERPLRAERGAIHQIFARKNALKRKQAGDTSGYQILSSNVDHVFITSSLNADLNYRRVERYLAIVREAGSIPILLLTKADVCADDLETVLIPVQKEFPDVVIHTVSRDTFGHADFLKRYLREGTTSVFIGSSGVGKSTLVNYLIGEEKVKTQEAREGDDKGRHTTTSRNLYISQFGGLIIDTPGMRELQLSDHVEGVFEQFSDVEELKMQCRFGDCGHETEPGCAIKLAMQEGTLTKEKWQSYLKLQAEVEFAKRKQDKALGAEVKKIWKKKTVEARQRSIEKRKKKP